MKPFLVGEFSEPTKLQKMLNKHPPGNPIRELENVLAEKTVDNLSKEDIKEINEKYKISIEEKHKNEILSIVERFIDCYFNLELPNRGVEFLPKLAELLGIDDIELNSLVEKVGSIVFRNHYKQAISDRRLTDDEDQRLKKLASYLGLENNLAEEISVEVRSDALNAYFSQIIEDGEISPAEYNELFELGKSLQAELTFDEATKEMIEKMRLIWRINHEELSTIEVPIRLQKNEVCYYSAQAGWYELRTGVTNIPYRGWRGNIKFGKRLYYRYGNIKYRRNVEQELTKIDAGIFYITNKRVVYTGNSKGNKSILFSRILGIESYKNGIEIQKDAGKSPFIEIADDIQILSAIFTRALSDSMQ